MIGCIPRETKGSKKGLTEEAFNTCGIVLLLSIKRIDGITINTTWRVSCSEIVSSIAPASFETPKNASVFLFLVDDERSSSRSRSRVNFVDFGHL